MWHREWYSHLTLKPGTMASPSCPTMPWWRTNDLDMNDYKLPDIFE
jgi:hypothetical protein